MGYEIDFFPASDGLAVVVRWGRPGNYQTLVYDGGSVASGAQVVAHIEGHCRTTRVDFVVSSHPVRPHAAGLAVVLGRLKVGELWVHQPWLHSDRCIAMAGPARRLVAVALARGVLVREPYEGAVIGPFTVLSPGRQWYVDALLPRWVARSAILDRSRFTDLTSWFRGLTAWLNRGRGADCLPRQVAPVSAAHASSAVLYAEFEGRGVLLTGNAGGHALGHACDFAEQLGLRLPTNLRFMQVPNRGSASHFTGPLLDRIVGERLSSGLTSATRKSAFISAGPNASALFSRATIDAMARRGVATFLTNGNRLHHAHNMPVRDWRPASREGDYR